MERYEDEFGRREEQGFAALTWDAIDGDETGTREFLEFGFSLQRSTILTATEVSRPAKYNPAISVRPLESDADWARYEEIHFDPDWKYGDEKSQREFLREEGHQLRSMVDAGLGVRFVAELGVEVAVIHGDPHPGNLRLDGRGRVGLLDWDESRVDLVWHDLSNLGVAVLDPEAHTRAEALSNAWEAANGWVVEPEYAARRLQALDRA